MQINITANETPENKHNKHSKENKTELQEALADATNICIERREDLDNTCLYWKFYYDIKNGNNTIGYAEINHSPEEKYITIGHVSLYPEFRNKWLWNKTYISLVNYFQKPIITGIHTYTAERVRKSLFTKWYAEFREEKHYLFKDLETLVQEWKAHYEDGKIIID